MEYILRAALQVASFLILQTVLLQLVEQSRFQKYIRIFSGFLLILLLLSFVFSASGKENFLEQIEKQVGYQLEDSDFRMRLAQAEEESAQEIKKEYEREILGEIETLLAQERLFLIEGRVDLKEDASIEQIFLTISRVVQDSQGSHNSQDSKDSHDNQNSQGNQDSQDSFDNFNSLQEQEKNEKTGKEKIQIEEIEPIEAVEPIGFSSAEASVESSGEEEEAVSEEKTQEKVENVQDKENARIIEQIAARFGIQEEKVILSWKDEGKE